MRVLVVIILWVAALTTSARANSAYDDVPHDHWIYPILEELSDQDYILGYPDGFFDGSITLSRYEISLAVANLMDTYSIKPKHDGRRLSKITPDEEEQLRIQIENLRSEFASELGALTRTFALYYSLGLYVPTDEFPATRRHTPIEIRHHPICFGYYDKQYNNPFYCVIYDDANDCCYFAPFVRWNNLELDDPLEPTPRVGVFYKFNSKYQLIDTTLVYSFGSMIESADESHSKYPGIDTWVGKYSSQQKHTKAPIPNWAQNLIIQVEP